MSGLKGASEVDMNQVNRNKSGRRLRAKQPSRNINTAGPNRKFVFSEWVVVSIAMLALLAAEAMLCSSILGTNYYGVDGKMAQTTILAALKFGSPFSINNLNPIEGVGSQLLPMNAWANPAYWPFALLDPELAADVSAIVALGIFALACYLMARCFDVPALPSILAAQSTIVLFAPILLLVHMPTVFCLTPGNAVVYAPHMVALGLLGRVESGPWRNTALATAGISTLLFYSLYCDPLWTLVDGISWALPFAVVTFGSLRWRTILTRCAVLGFCLALLVVSGAAEYLYTLSQYTARVQFPLVLDRVRGPVLVSALSYSPNMKTFYVGCMLGWLIGLIALRGRPRVLVAAGFITFLAWAAYSVVYLLILDKPWIPPIPIYVEQCLFPLYLTSAIAGYWAVLRVAADWRSRLWSLAPARAADWSPQRVRRSAFSAVQSVRMAAVRYGALPLARFLSPLARSLSIVDTSSLSFAGDGGPSFRGTVAPMLRSISVFLRFALVAIIPGMLVNFALSDAAPFRRTFYERWPNEPEVIRLFSHNLGQTIGEPFRGSIFFWAPDYPANLTIVSLWARGISTVNEYSQLVTPQALYFTHILFQLDVRGSLNLFQPFYGKYSPSYWEVLRLFGARYFMGYVPLAPANEIGLTLITLPHTVVEKEPAVWQIYELAHPNVGDFSPTEIMTAGSGAETMRLLASPNFDFSRQAVIESEIGAPLVPARDMRMLRIRGGVHVSGKSNGTSLVILPQQFTHCLRARDQRVRLVRADLMMTGVIFSGDLDTDILFDYGIFSPRCRRADLADVRRLGMTIDLRMPHLVGDRVFPDWEEVKAKLGAAVSAIQ
jgi:hypothetical protein